MRIGRSMAAQPRYHAQDYRARGRGDDIRLVAGAIGRLLGARSSRGEWREATRLRSQPWRWTGDLRRFDGFSQEPSQEGPTHGNGRRIFTAPEKGRTLAKTPPRTWPRAGRSSMRPRRGHPVAAIRVPRWYLYQHDEWEKRQPRGFVPGGPLWEGPERSAKEP